MQRYSTYSNFKKMSLMLIAHSSTTSEICELRKVFDQYDTANNGFISHAEFKHALSRFDNKYSEEEIDKLFNAVNFDEGGLINYTEFLAATLETVGHIEEERLAGAFDRFDDDDSGFISKKNLRRILGKTYTEAKVEQLIAEGDYENDGKISYEEFLMLFRDDCEKEKMVFRKSIRETHPEVFINFNSEETQVTQTSEYSDTSSNVSARKNSILLS
uniref:Calmodulin n=1 Tax=Corethron hystrix TaxID=216773 RepID=A0A7S1C308_9STRA|mmetsp:Transcript_9726/g.21664  ORF Transcript_9726/g.21664 Transcript_9726/m.21664 type:complete len:216 (+) Transcript_9726:1039-1686(+)